MSNIEEDIKKLNSLIEGCKECKFATCEQCEINWTEVQAIEHILAEREEDKKRIKELEAKLEFKEYGDLDNLKFEEYMNEFIAKQKVKDEFNKLNTRIKEFKDPEIKKYFSIEQIIDLLEQFENKLWEDK